MVTLDRTLNNAACEWESKIATNTAGVLDSHTAQALRTLSNSFARLGKSNSAQESVQMQIPNHIYTYFNGPNHSMATRLSVDAGVVKEIKDSIEEYKKDIIEAASNVRLSAEAQVYRIEVFDKMMAALYKDSLLHTKELRSLFRQYSGKFRREETYEGLVASAATLRGTVREVTRKMSVHLEGMAKREMLAANAPKLRKDA